LFSHKRLGSVFRKSSKSSSRQVNPLDSVLNQTLAMKSQIHPEKKPDLLFRHPDFVYSVSRRCGDDGVEGRPFAVPPMTPAFQDSRHHHDDRHHQPFTRDTSSYDENTKKVQTGESDDDDCNSVCGDGDTKVDHTGVDGGMRHSRGERGRREDTSERHGHDGPAASRQQPTSRKNDYSVEELLRNDRSRSSCIQTDTHQPSDIGHRRSTPVTAYDRKMDTGPSKSHHEEAGTTPSLSSSSQTPNSAFHHISWNVEPLLPPVPPFSMHATPHHSHWPDWMMLPANSLRGGRTSQFDSGALQRRFCAPLFFDVASPVNNFVSTLQPGTTERHQLLLSTTFGQQEFSVPRRSRNWQYHISRPISQTIKK